MCVCVRVIARITIRMFGIRLSCTNNTIRMRRFIINRRSSSVRILRILVMYYIGRILCELRIVLVLLLL